MGWPEETGSTHRPGLGEWAGRLSQRSKRQDSGEGFSQGAPQDGFHAWTVEEVLQYRERHPVGTKAWLALALLLYVGARRADIPALGREHISNGWLRYTPQKNRNGAPVTLDIPVLPPLQEAIDACPEAREHLTFLTTEFGEPLSANGFGNWFKKRCTEAGLPHCSAQGLRKAGATLAAENGATEKQLMAMFSFRTPKQTARYTRAADQKKLAGAMHLIQLDGSVNTSGPTSASGGTCSGKQ